LAKPGVKLRYALLLVGVTHGVGKSTLGKIIGEVLGSENHIPLLALTITDDRFTHWADKQLIVIHEIYEDHSIKAYKKLQPVISEGDISVRKMHQMEYRVENFVNVLACSNSEKALQLPDEDRRWLVVRAAERLNTEAFWKELFDWLDNQDGYRKVKQWAKDFVASHGAVADGEHAPNTEAK
jgi:hypothetical protein